jgi:hypothetical protein
MKELKDAAINTSISLKMLKEIRKKEEHAQDFMKQEIRNKKKKRRQQDYKEILQSRKDEIELAQNEQQMRQKAEELKKQKYSQLAHQKSDRDHKVSKFLLITVFKLIRT